MKPIKTIILDDEERSLKVLEYHLKSMPQIQLLASLSDAKEAVNQINSIAPQLLLLDINMPHFNGFEVLERLKVPGLKFIFVTAYDQFAIKAFQYSAVDYLLKPLDEDLLRQAIIRVADQIEGKDDMNDVKTLLFNMRNMVNPQKMKLCISSMNGFVVINTEDIIYAEADSCYTIFKLIDGRQLVSSKTLAEYEETLESGRFIRIHRSYIINMSHFTEYKKGLGGSIIMANGDELEVSRRKKDEFLTKIKQVFGA